MIEPTETENRQTLDEFAQAMGEVLTRGKEWMEGAPYTTPVRRLDEVQANRKPVLRYQG